MDVTAFPDAGDGFGIGVHRRWFSAGEDERRITCSSDGGGCLPIFDDDGEMLHMDVGRSSVLLETIRELLNIGYSWTVYCPASPRMWHGFYVLKMWVEWRQHGCGSDGDG